MKNWLDKLNKKPQINADERRYEERVEVHFNLNNEIISEANG